MRGASVRFPPNHGAMDLIFIRETREKLVSEKWASLPGHANPFKSGVGFLLVLFRVIYQRALLCFTSSLGLTTADSIGIDQPVTKFH